MNTKKISLIVFILCIFPIQGIFAFSGDTNKPQTLREMQEQTQELEKQETVLQFKWSTFQLGNDSLGDIIKEDLSGGERSDLEDIINYYTKVKDDLESDLDKSVNAGRNTEEIKKQLLEGKHRFYKELIPFIQIEKLDSFKKYVDNDLNYNEKSKDISVQIEEKNIEKTQRLEEIKDKIDDNSRDLRKKIEETIKNEVQTKLDIFITKEKFQNLNGETKIKIFSNIIRKFDTVIKDLEDNANPTRALDERIIGLEIVVEILEGYIDSWK